MRIALFHNTPSGGAKRAIFEWTRRLAVNHQIDVYTLSSADHDFCDIRPFVQQHHVFDFTPRRLFNSPWGRLNQLQRWWDLGELTQLEQEIAARIDTGNYDLVFAHTCQFTFIPLVLQFVQTPSLYYLHEPFGRQFTRHFQRPYLNTNYVRQTIDRFDPLIDLYHHRLDQLQRKSIYQVGRLLANSQFTREHMNNEFALETPVCHCGVNWEGFRYIPDSQKKDFVLSVGELSPRKGFDFLIESLGYIPKAERPKLKIACNSVVSEEKLFIENLAIELDVELEILLSLDMAELTTQFNQARLCLYAPVLEPFGLVPLEAMACGTPVVGVCEAGVKESVVHQQTGLLVERDPAQFAEAVCFLLANSALAAEYGRNGREHVLRNWTWEQSVAELESHMAACADMPR